MLRAYVNVISICIKNAVQRGRILFAQLTIIHDISCMDHLIEQSAVIAKRQWYVFSTLNKRHGKRLNFSWSIYIFQLIRLATRYILTNNSSPAITLVLPNPTSNCFIRELIWSNRNRRLAGNGTKRWVESFVRSWNGFPENRICV